MDGLIRKIYVENYTDEKKWLRSNLMRLFPIAQAGSGHQEFPRNHS